MRSPVLPEISGNLVTSFPVRITSTTGVNPPDVQLTLPFSPPIAQAHVEDGKIKSIDLLHQDGGNGFYSNPEVVISGIHDVAIASVDQIINGGIGPLPSDGTEDFYIAFWFRIPSITLIVHLR